MYFKDWNWISKTVNCISCSVVYKIFFPDIPNNAGEREKQEWEEGEEDHRQLQSVMRFTQTQQANLKGHSARLE